MSARTNCRVILYQPAHAYFRGPIRLGFWAAHPEGQRSRGRPADLQHHPTHVDAAVAGLGIALLPEDELMPHIEAGTLVRVLSDGCPKFAGYHLYSRAEGNLHRHSRWCCGHCASAAQAAV